MKKLFALLCSTLLLLSNMQISYADNDILKDDSTYRLIEVKKDGSQTLIEEYSSYFDAYESFKQQKDHYENLSIAKGLNYLNCEYGVVAIQSNETCTLNSEYRNAFNNENGYSNGCYGGDAAFLKYNANAHEVLFELSSTQAWIDADQVKIYPLSLVPNVTQYKVINGNLYHYIKSNAQSATFTNILELSKAPTSLKEDVIYYSFDSHYFYDEYEKMIDDKNNDSHQNAINKDEPYYNYYQYIPHRTSSNYTYAQFNEYLTNIKYFTNTMQSFYDPDGNNSHNILSESLVMQGNKAFIHYQNQFGANAIMMLSLALNESGNGRSILAFERNNLFGHAAFDEAVAQNASRYQSVSDSIYSHAYHYINKSYGDFDAFQYHGSQFGNKAGGMNVQYASDPYWGEKAAQYYYQFDKAMNELDYNAYALGISGKKAMSVYSDPSGSHVLYNIADGKEVSFVLLEDLDPYYKVQLDDSSAYTYSYQNDVAYVLKSDLAHVMNEDKISEKQYVTITFDANGGTYHPDKEIIQMDVEKGQLPTVLDPIKAGYVFIGYDQELVSADQQMRYVAQYKQIKEMNISSNFKTTYEQNEHLDLSDTTLNLILEDNSEMQVPLTTDYVEAFDSSELGKKHLDITYCDKTITVEVEVVENIEDEAQTLRNDAANIIATYSEAAIDTQARAYFKEFKYRMLTQNDNPLSIDVIRAVDRIIQPNLKNRYSVIISDDKYDLQISGLSLAIEEEDIFVHQYAPVTIKVNLESSNTCDQSEIFDKIATANYLKLEDYITFNGSVDFNDYDPKIDVVYSLKKLEGSENKLFKVLTIDDEGNVIMLPTYQSESRILFKGTTKTYALCSMEVSGIEGSFDFTEVNLQAQNGSDYILKGVYIPAIALVAGFVLLLILIIVIIKVMKKKKAGRQ